MENPTNETPSQYNSKEFQHIVDYEALSEDDAETVKKLYKLSSDFFRELGLAGEPLDEPVSDVTSGLTRIELIKGITEIRKSP